MSEEQTVTYELDGEVALVGLNRPDKRNCFNPTVMKQLREAIDRAGEEAKCGIIFGHGDNFCAGLDLRWAAENWKNGRSQRLPFQFNRNSFFEAMARGSTYSMTGPLYGWLYCAGGSRTKIIVPPEDRRLRPSAPRWRHSGAAAPLSFRTARRRASPV